jgi:hypothetical protein
MKLKCTLILILLICSKSIFAQDTKIENANNDIKPTLEAIKSEAPVNTDAQKALDLAEAKKSLSEKLKALEATAQEAKLAEEKRLAREKEISELKEKLARDEANILKEKQLAAAKAAEDAKKQVEIDRLLQIQKEKEAKLEAAKQLQEKQIAEVQATKAAKKQAEEDKIAREFKAKKDKEEAEKQAEKDKLAKELKAKEDAAIATKLLEDKKIADELAAKKAIEFEKEKKEFLKLQAKNNALEKDRLVVKEKIAVSEKEIADLNQNLETQTKNGKLTATEIEKQNIRVSLAKIKLNELKDELEKIK